MRSTFLTAACLLTCTFSSFLVAAEHSDTLRVFFDTDSDLLRAVSASELKNFIEQSDRTGDYRFAIRGHTDSRGSYEYNDDLALRRAQQVRDAMLDFGLTEFELSLEAYGEHAPEVSNTSSQNLQQNRRVEVVFRKLHFDNLDELQEELGADNDVELSYPSTQSRQITSRRGSIVSIPEQAFVLPDGSHYNGMVNLQITEALEIKDFLAEGLMTLSDGQLIQSGGMMKITALSEDGQSLELGDGIEVTVALPAASRVAGMQLFVSDSGQNWSATGQLPMDERNLGIPSPPERFYPQWKEPKFKEDLSTKPRVPAIAVCPKRPSAPSQPGTDVEWYRYPWKKSILAKRQHAYEHQLVQYERRMKRYETRVKNYEKLTASYPSRYALYLENLEAWKQEQMRLAEEFEANVVLPSRKQYEAEVIKLMGYFDREMDNWYELRAQKMADYYSKLDGVGITDVAIVNNYVFSVARLGWINCDRFYDIPPVLKTEILVEAGEKLDGVVQVIWPEINACAGMALTEEGYRISGVPMDQKAHVLAYRVVDGKIELYHEVWDRFKQLNLEYRPGTFAELQTIMSEIRRTS